MRVAAERDVLMCGLLMHRLLAGHPALDDADMGSAAVNTATSLGLPVGVLSAGAMPVFLSSYDHFPDAGTIVSSYPILSKPPQADELAAAVIDAMRRKWLNSEGLLDDR